MSAKHLCICAVETDEYHGFECEITGGACIFYRPNQDACAEQYGEVGHTKQWNSKHGITEDNSEDEENERYWNKRNNDKQKWETIICSKNR